MMKYRCGGRIGPGLFYVSISVSHLKQRKFPYSGQGPITVAARSTEMSSYA
jgi:hypothetical protein